ncbi:hypothetical protein Glove_141g92 [Diversispora epigaea]|uniref:TLDc domain-containing protein n=1 Tax=Diversispora epigaea TaxID=1348612 RepID=A0A397J156_9GLOM|nr:hypothetical protein Glove_141g92 [Diversispora epigaea]
MHILPKSARETKSEFFGKKGWTLHSILMYTKQENDEKLNIAAFDHWSTDTKQDAWFTASSLHAVFEIMSNKPKWIILISDTGPHYHNTEMMLIMAHWKERYDIEVREWIFLEADEAKTAIDFHRAQIVHAIKRYVRIGFEIKEGNDIEKAIKDLRGTSIGELNPNREKLDKKIKSLVGISNLNEWKWPIEGPFAGYIQARPLPKIGNYINYSPAQIEKLSKSETIKPKPTLSTPTNSQFTWIVPISNFDTNSKRTKIDTLSNEIMKYKYRKKFYVKFQLMSGWALKANQKFGKRGGAKMSKRIITLLQGFFHAGNANKSDRYTAHDMLSELNDMATKLSNILETILIEDKASWLKTHFSFVYCTIFIKENFCNDFVVKYPNLIINNIDQHLVTPDRPIKLNILPARSVLVTELPPRAKETFSTSISEDYAAEISSWIDRKTTTYSTTNFPYKFELILCGTRDGFVPQTFWNICHGHACTIVIAKVKGTDEIIGGYNPLAWDNALDGNSDEWMETKDSFIFSLKNGSIQNSILSRVKKTNCAILYERKND